MKKLIAGLLGLAAVAVTCLVVARPAAAIGVVDRSHGILVRDGLMATWWEEGGSQKTLPTKATFTVGALTSNRHDVDVQWKDGDATATAYPYETYCWASTSSVGAGYVTTAGTSAFSAVTNGAVESVTSGKSANVITSATGLATVRVTQTSSTVPAQYLCCKSALGVTLCSASMTF